MPNIIADGKVFVDGQEIETGLRQADAKADDLARVMGVDHAQGDDRAAVCASGNPHGFATGGLVSKETWEKILRLDELAGAPIPRSSLFLAGGVLTPLWMRNFAREADEKRHRNKFMRDFEPMKGTIREEVSSRLRDLRKAMAEAVRASRLRPTFHRPNTNRNTRRRMILAEKRREEIRGERNA